MYDSDCFYFLNSREDGNDFLAEIKNDITIRGIKCSFAVQIESESVNKKILHIARIPDAKSLKLIAYNSKASKTPKQKENIKSIVVLSCVDENLKKKIKENTEYFNKQDKNSSFDKKKFLRVLILTNCDQMKEDELEKLRLVMIPYLCDKSFSIVIETSTITEKNFWPLLKILFFINFFNDDLAEPFSPGFFYWYCFTAPNFLLKFNRLTKEQIISKKYSLLEPYRPIQSAVFKLDRLCDQCFQQPVDNILTPLQQENTKICGKCLRVNSLTTHNELFNL